METPVDSIGRSEHLQPVLPEEGMKSVNKVESLKPAIRHFSFHLTAIALLVFGLLSLAQAQDDHKFTFQVGGGVSPLTGAISERLDNGWHVTVGGGYNFTRRFSTSVQYTYNGFGVSHGVLLEAQVPDGNAHMWSITLDPKLRLCPNGKFDPYVAGGVGYYRRTVEFTQPSVLPVFFFDPFFGAFFNTLVPADRVLGDITRDGIGGSVGAGVDFKLGESGLKFFTEARYHYADTGRIPTRMVPVTFGIRW
jgi:opacity protein-like surface antigen